MLEFTVPLLLLFVIVISSWKAATADVHCTIPDEESVSTFNTTCCVAVYNGDQALVDALNTVIAGDTIAVFPGAYSGRFRVQQFNIQLTGVANCSVPATNLSTVFLQNPRAPNSQALMIDFNFVDNLQVDAVVNISHLDVEGIYIVGPGAGVIIPGSGQMKVNVRHSVLRYIDVSQTLRTAVRIENSMVYHYFSVSGQCEATDIHIHSCSLLPVEMDDAVWDNSNSLEIAATDVGMCVSNSTVHMQVVMASSNTVASTFWPRRLCAGGSTFIGCTFSYPYALTDYPLPVSHTLAGGLVASSFEGLRTAAVDVMNTLVEQRSPVFQSCVFENFSCTYPGCAILGAAVVRDSTFSLLYSSSILGGGAIKGLVRVERSLFHDISALGHGGAISNSGSDILNKRALTILNCTFVRCSSESYGGAVWLVGGIIRSSYFRACSAALGGGAIGLGTADVSLITVSSSIFVYCVSLFGNGGAVSIVSEFASVVLVDNAFLNSSSATGNGGCVYVAPLASVTLAGPMTFSNCYALQGLGGAVFFDSFSNIQVTDVVGVSVPVAVQYFTALGCQAKQGGGFVFASSSKIELRAPLSLTFDGCHAAIAGGALVLPTGVLLTSSYGLANRTSLIIIQNCSAGLLAGGLLMGCPRIEAALQFALSFDHSLIGGGMYMSSDACTCSLGANVTFAFQSNIASALKAASDYAVLIDGSVCHSSPLMVLLQSSTHMGVVAPLSFRICEGSSLGVDSDRIQLEDTLLVQGCLSLNGSRLFTTDLVDAVLYPSTCLLAADAASCIASSPLASVAGNVLLAGPFRLAGQSSSLSDVLTSGLRFNVSLGPSAIVRDGLAMFPSETILPSFSSAYHVDFLSCPAGRVLTVATSLADTSMRSVSCSTCPPTTFSVFENSIHCFSCPSTTSVICSNEQVLARSGFYVYFQFTGGREGASKIFSGSIVPHVFACDPYRCVGYAAVCADGFEKDAVLCGGCMDGMSYWNGSCIACAETDSFAIFLLFMSSFLFVIILHFWSQRRSSGAAISILVAFVQNCSIIVFPAHLSVLNAVNILSLSLYSPSGGACPFPRHRTELFTSDVLFVVGHFAGLAFLFSVALWFRRLVPTYFSLSAFGSTLLALSLLAFQKILQLSTFFTICRSLGVAGAVVATEPSISCSSEEYAQLLPAFYSLSGVCAIFVLALVFLLHRYPSTVEVITVRYRVGAAWYEIVVLMRKTALVLVVALGMRFQSADANFVGPLLVFLFSLNLLIVLVAMPFKRKADAWLEGFCLIVLAVVATFDVGNYPELIEVIRYIVLSVLGAGVCYFMYFCAMSRREAAREKSVNAMKLETELTQSFLQDGLYAANDEQQPYFSGENDEDILAGTRSDELLKHDL